MSLILYVKSSKLWKYLRSCKNDYFIIFKNIFCHKKEAIAILQLHVTRAHKLRLPINTHKGTEYISTQWPESLPEYIYFVRSKINYNTKYTSSLTLCWNLNIINCQKFNITIYQNNSCLTNQNIDLTDGYITQLFVQGLDIFLNIWQLAVIPTVI